MSDSHEAHRKEEFIYDFIPAHLQDGVRDTLRLVSALSDRASLSLQERQVLGHQTIRFTMFAAAAGSSDKVNDLWARAGSARFPSAYSLREKARKLAAPMSARVARQSEVLGTLLLARELSELVDLDSVSADALRVQMRDFAITATAGDTGVSVRELWMTAGEQSGAYALPRENSSFNF
jgi:hypothetical protein